MKVTYLKVLIGLISTPFGIRHQRKQGVYEDDSCFASLEICFKLGEGKQRLNN